MSIQSELQGLSRIPIIQTKLAPPRPPRQLIAREALLQSLSLGARRTLTLIKAPAGFGKTTLLQEWRETRLASRSAVAWLTLDEDDNDATQFVACLTAALREAFKSLGHDAPTFAEAGRITSHRIALTSIVNSLEALGQELTLILDDYDRITDAEIHEIVTFLVMHAPTRLHLLIATRSEPPLPLSYLRAHDQLIELDARNLRFGIDETRLFLSDACTLNLAASDVRVLHEATEGWVAGLQIAAMVLRGRNDPSAAVRSFSGSYRAINEYLAQNVLPRVPPEIVDFMLRTSLLDRLSGPLCEQMLGIENGQRVLLWLEAQNCFLQALDEEREWYRYNALFADFLRAELKNKFAAEIPLLHTRASKWFVQRELWAEAVRHALAADHVAQAIDWLERCAIREVEDSNVRTLLAWVKKLPQQAVSERIGLAVAVAWALALTSQLDAARAVVNDVHQRLSGYGAAEEAAVEWELNALRATIAGFADDSAEALKYASLCLKQQPKRDYWEDRGLWVDSVVRNVFTFAHEKNGNLEMARIVQSVLYRSSNAPLRSLFANVYRLCLLGACDLREGLLHNGGKRFEEGLRVAEQRVGRRSAAAALAACYLAALHYEWNDLEQVEQLLADRLDVVDEACFLDAVQLASLSMVRLYISRNDIEAAHALLDHTEILAASRAWPRLIAACAAERSRLCLLAGQPAQAAQALRRLESIAPAAAPVEFGTAADTYRHLQVARCRVLLHQQAFSAAAALLHVIIASDEQSGNVLSATRTRLLLAVALEGDGQRIAALACLSAALVVAERAGMTRSILDEGEVVANLLVALQTQCHGRKPCAPSPAYLQHLLECFGRAPGAGEGPAAATPAQPELLSQRERDVMELVAQGLSNKEIARILVITVETVKWHLKNIYSKLGVSGRTLAVNQLRVRALLGRPRH